MNKKFKTELIEQYLDEELQGIERQDFESELKSNKELTNEVTLHKIIRETVKEKDFYEIDEQLRNLRKLPKRIKIRRLVASFSFLAIAIISGIFFFNGSKSNDELYSQYYKPYNAALTKSNYAAQDIFSRAIDFYNKQDYNQAISLLEQIKIDSELYASKEYFTAISYMGLQNFPEAIIHFKNISNDTESINYENTVWYLGLCYLKTNKTEQASQQFHQLIKNNSIYKKQAEEILNEL